MSPVETRLSSHIVVIHRRAATAIMFATALVASAFAQAPASPPIGTYDYPGAHTANGAPDAGTTTTAPNGSTTTTYQDGWTKTTEPDNTFNPPGTKTTIKDGQGRIREILKKDAAGTWRHHTLIELPAGITTYHNWDANGRLIDSTKETETPGKPKKVERWDPETGKYVLASAGSSLPFGLTGSALALAAILFVLGLLIGRGTGGRNKVAN